MPSLTPLIHIGLHKTGTTWLQNTILRQARHGLAHWNNELRLRNKFREIFLTYKADFDAQAVRAYYDGQRVVGDNDGLIPVISSERLSGNPHLGGYDRYEIANRLASMFPEARIAIGIREQRSIIRSCYSQFVNGGGLMRLEDYLKDKTGRGPSFTLNHFRYDALLDLYGGLFGHDNVVLLPYEELRSDPVAYLNRLMVFCKLNPIAALTAEEFEPVHPSAGCTSTNVRRRLNIFMRRDILNGFTPLGTNIGQRIGEKISDSFNSKLFGGRDTRLRQEWRRIIENRVGDFYHASNSRLAQVTGIDLKSMGYATSE
jgi:hypothetical protein